MHKSCNWSLPIRPSDQDIVCISHLSHACYMPYSPHAPWSRNRALAKYRGTICDSLVGIALGYGLDDRGSRVRFPARAWNFSLHHRVQNGSGAHPASYPMGNRGSFPGGNRPGREAGHSPPSSAEVKEWVELYLHSPKYAFMAWCSVKAQGQLCFYLSPKDISQGLC
jgi:hypothetical protein